MIKKTPSDTLTNIITLSSVFVFILFVLSLIASLIWHSLPSIQRFGFSFLTKSNWNIKYLEVSNVRLVDSSFKIQFTSEFSNPQQNLLSLSYNNSPLPFTLEQSRNTLILTPQFLSNGNYEILIQDSFLDIHNQPILNGVRWSANISNNTSINAELINTSNNKAQKIIQNENERYFGMIAFIIGTIVSSVLALLMAFPIALSSAIYLTEYAHPKSKLAKSFAILIDLLAGIPSVIYGLWALFFIVPRMGANLFTASIVLATMTIPYSASLIREALSLVPQKIRDAGLGLGASQMSVISKVVLPYARSGIIAGALLTLGRALGETLAVTMVVGNRNLIPSNIFQPAQTIASLIANEYGESSGLKQSALIEAGLVLIVITLLFSLLGRFIIRWYAKEQSR